MHGLKPKKYRCTSKCISKILWYFQWKLSVLEITGIAIISTSKIFFTTIKTCVQYLNYPTLLFDVKNALKRILTNNVNLKLSTFIIYFNNIQSGSRNSILDYNHETNAVTCFACRQFSGSSPLCVTDWKNATSFRIYIWVLRLQMMQSLQSTSTQSSRGLSKVSAYWVANLYRTKPAVLLNITTLWEM